MTNLEASKRRADLWAQLEPLLVRSLGAEGAADWLEFAGQQLRIKSKRERIATPLERVQ